MFIATIAVVAPFMPDEIEVLAYKAYVFILSSNQQSQFIMVSKHVKDELGKEIKKANLCMSGYTPDLSTASLQVGYLLPQSNKLPS